MVLDASALLALLFREEGHEIVADALEGAIVSAVNWSEVAQKLDQRGLADPASIADRLVALGLQIRPFTRRDANSRQHSGPRPAAPGCRSEAGHAWPSRWR